MEAKLAFNLTSARIAKRGFLRETKRFVDDNTR